MKLQTLFTLKVNISMLGLGGKKEKNTSKLVKNFPSSAPGVPEIPVRQVLSRVPAPQAKPKARWERSGTPAITTERGQERRPGASVWSCVGEPRCRNCRGVIALSHPFVFLG